MPSNFAGYLLPTSGPSFPGGLTLTQFIQSVIVGITGFDGTLVRPEWQVEVPKQPALTTDWIAFGVKMSTPDWNSYVATDADGNSFQQRQQLLEIPVSFYGPNAIDNILKFQDGFQITQNSEALSAASMGYQSVTPATRGPDLVHGRWVERMMCSLYLTWQVQRAYAILSLESAGGSIHTVVSGEDYNSDWQTPEGT